LDIFDEQEERMGRGEDPFFDFDRACRGFTSSEGETGLSQHQDGSSSPVKAQTCIYYAEPLRGCP
jgi:hypothetical protein